MSRITELLEQKRAARNSLSQTTPDPEKKLQKKNEKKKPKQIKQSQNKKRIMKVNTLPSEEAKSIAGGEGSMRRYKPANAIVTHSTTQFVSAELGFP